MDTTTVTTTTTTTTDMNSKNLEEYEQRKTLLNNALESTKMGRELVETMTKYRNFPSQRSITSIQKVHSVLKNVLCAIASSQDLLPSGVVTLPKVVVHATYCGSCFYLSSSKHTSLACEVVSCVLGCTEISECSAERSSPAVTNLMQVLRAIEDAGYTAVVVMDVPFGYPPSAMFFKVVSLRLDAQTGQLVDSEFAFSSLDTDLSPTGTPKKMQVRTEKILTKAMADKNHCSAAFTRNNQMVDIDVEGGLGMLTILKEASAPGDEERASGLAQQQQHQQHCLRCQISERLVLAMKNDIQLKESLHIAREQQFEQDLRSIETHTIESVRQSMEEDISHVYSQFEEARCLAERFRVNASIFEDELQIAETAEPPSAMMTELADLRGRVVH